jgi:hypothetical protein
MGVHVCFKEDPSSYLGWRLNNFTKVFVIFSASSDTWGSTAVNIFIQTSSENLIT